jgi:hypothetical protein
MEKPAYRHASYAKESVVLENSRVKIKFFKRLCGWGFAEIYTPEGRLMAVLDHFGELLARDQEIPMRFEGDSYELKKEGGLQILSFPVAATMAQQKLAGTSFENWVHFPFVETAAQGTVTFSLKEGENAVQVSYALMSNANLYVKYLRGPWLLAGEESFGSKRDDAIFPGIDWCTGDEWSSGTDFFKDPWANRAIPHPGQVAAPVMAVSQGGDSIGLAWDPNQTWARWFNYRDNHPQPVFASPNFVERRSNSLLGLMLPEVFEESEANKPMADVPMELHIGQYINLDAEIILARGNSLDLIVDWVKRHGLPQIKNPRWTIREALDRIANAYNTNLWHEGEGFGAKQRETDTYSPIAPAFLRRYAKEHASEPTGKELQKKIDWCDSAGHGNETGRHSPEIYTAGTIGDAAARRARCDEILSWQKEDGSFVFEPDGRHYTKDDFKVARYFIEPMGLDQDTALHICTMPAFELLLFYRVVKEEKYGAAARKALDFALPCTRPEAGDYWETPLHAPNLLAAGQAANVYYLAFQIFGDEKYRKKAIYWLRSLIPFTHLWESKTVPNLYNTKPCLCCSDWYFANWVRDHVQWEVLTSFASSAALGFEWNKIDPEIDWRLFQEGVTTAVFRWMVDHRDNTWRPHNLPLTYKPYLAGEYDCCFADTHNSIHGNYGGGLIMPGEVADNIYSLIDQGR